MSVAGEPVKAQTASRLGAVVVGLAAAVLFAAFIGHVELGPSNGAGGFGLTKVVRAIGAEIADGKLAALLIRLVSASVVGLLLMWFYDQLRYSEWGTLSASLLVVALAGNALIIGAVVDTPGMLPAMVAAGALIPAIRRLESVGDVQAQMSFGMVLSLLLLAGPEMALLILPLAAAGAFADPLARSDYRAYLAMFLVALMPAALVLCGLAMLTGGRVIWDGLAFYGTAFAPRAIGADTLVGWVRIVGLGVLSYGIVPAAYLFFRDRRRQPCSAIAVVALPLYLAFGWLIFGWPTGPILPAAMLLATFASWLAAGRLTPIFRGVSLALALMGLVVSWTGFA